MQQLVAVGSARQDGGKRTAKVILDEPDALLLENTNDLPGEHCDVTACSSTEPCYCAQAQSGMVSRGVIEKLSSAECTQVIEIMRSIKLDP